MPGWQSRTSATTVNHLSDMLFEQLNIAPQTKQAVRDLMGYQTCSLIQALSIPKLLEGEVTAYLAVL